MRIKSWHMSVRTHKELVPRSVVGMQQDPTVLEQLSKNITRQGITNSTLNYLRVSTSEPFVIESDNLNNWKRFLRLLRQVFTRWLHSFHIKSPFNPFSTLKKILPSNFNAVVTSLCSIDTIEENFIETICISCDLLHVTFLKWVNLRNITFPTYEPWKLSINGKINTWTLFSVASMEY